MRPLRLCHRTLIVALPVLVVGGLASMRWDPVVAARATGETAAVLDPAVERVAQLPRMRSLLVSVMVVSRSSSTSTVPPPIAPPT